MFSLEKCVIESMEIENLDGTIETFTDEIWIRIYEAASKQMIRNYIEERGINNIKLRMIHPNGSISDPMKIKLQGETKRIKKPPKEERDRYENEELQNLELMTNKPGYGRTRFILNALKKMESIQ